MCHGNLTMQKSHFDTNGQACTLVEIDNANFEFFTVQAGMYPGSHPPCLPWK